ncbi:MAG: c-type cytochrome [Betaproteobacteria bacterium]
MKRNLWLAATISIAALALIRLPVAIAAEGAAKPDLAKAKQIVDTVCAACHGTDGNSTASVNPNLAGLGAEYITRQLQHFKSGIRASAVMGAMGSNLAPEEMLALGIYYNQQKPKGGVAKDPTLVKSGQAIFRGGVASSGVPACSSCHGPTGAGVPKNYPRLGAQHADYTYAQLKAFKSGERGADKEGKDVQGKIMADIARKMNDEQMKALADYAAGLR